MKEKAIELMTNMSNFFVGLSTKFYCAAMNLSKGMTASEVIKQLDSTEDSKEINEQLKDLFTLLLAMAVMEGGDEDG